MYVSSTYKSSMVEMVDARPHKIKQTENIKKRMEWNT